MDSTIGLLARYGYLVVFGSILAEQIGLPFPAIPLLLAAGALAGAGKLSFALLLLLSGIASLIADMVWYVIGRLGGAKVLGWPAASRSSPMRASGAPGRSSPSTGHAP